MLEKSISYSAMFLTSKVKKHNSERYGAMKIEGYEVIDHLFSEENGLEVYEVIEPSSKEKHIMRMANDSEQGSLQENWFATYNDYQSKVTNFKYLPRVLTVSMTNESKLFALLECKDGQLLRDQRFMSLDQFFQLMEAVHHLHKKKIIHASLTPNNIWIATDGSIALYGAGESKAFHPHLKVNEKTDTVELIGLLKDFSEVDQNILSAIEAKSPMTIGELEQCLDEPETEKNRKSGLVEKESVEENQQLEVEKEMPIPEKEAELKQEEESPPNRFDRNKKNPPKKNFSRLIGVIAIILAIIFFTDVFDDKEAVQNPVFSQNNSDVGSNENVVAVVPEVTDEVEVKEVSAEEMEEEAPPVTEEEPPQTFTSQDIKDFMDQYTALKINAINQQNFSLVEKLLDPSGEMYQEEKNYIDYLAGKGISEKLLVFTVDEVEQVNDSTYKVYTYEEYDIVYGIEGMQKKKSFNSAYLVNVMDNDKLGMNTLVYTDEIYSEDILNETSEEDYELDYEEDYEEDYESDEELVVEENVTKDDLEYFLQNYGYATMDAIRMNDFSYAEPFLDPNGKSYNESKDYIDYLNNKNISENLLTIEVTDVFTLNDETYQVNTYEEYDIFYEDGSSKFKSFNSQYKVKLIDGQLYVNELIDTTVSEEWEY